MEYSNILYSTAAALLGTVVWEHIARKKNSNVKPSVGIDYVYQKSKAGFTKLGEGLAVLSSFYTYVDLKDVGQTVSDLTEPTLKTLVSPYHMVRGYLAQANLYNHPYLVTAGTLTLVPLSYYLYTKCDPELSKSYLTVVSNFMKKLFNRSQ